MRVREHLFPGERHPMPNQARNTRADGVYIVESKHYKIYFLYLRCHLAQDRPRRKTFFVLVELTNRGGARPVRLQGARGCEPLAILRPT